MEQRLSNEQLDMLMSPLHDMRIAHRSQGGKQLSYVEAFDVKATLIRVFGFGGFSADVIDSKLLAIREASTTPGHVDKDGKAKTPQVICSATVRLTIYGFGPEGQDVTYTESAIGANSGSDIGDAADNAIKTAASDALKRCATYLGSQFGLSLYDNGKNYEVIRRIYEPRQAGMLLEVAAAREEAEARVMQAAQAGLERATGQRAREDSAEAPAPADAPGTGS